MAQSTSVDAAQLAVEEGSSRRLEFVPFEFYGSQFAIFSFCEQLGKDPLNWEQY